MNRKNAFPMGKRPTIKSRWDIVDEVGWDWAGGEDGGGCGGGVVVVWLFCCYWSHCVG